MNVHVGCTLQLLLSSKCFCEGARRTTYSRGLKKSYFYMGVNFENFHILICIRNFGGLTGCCAMMEWREDVEEEDPKGT